MVTDLMINHNRPLVMHIDLNSCFATATQQAFPHLRGKPMVVAAYDSPRGCILASSIEAKKLGIKTGMRVMEAKHIYKNIVVRTTDTDLVRDIHIRLRRITRDYSTVVVPKSIDEVVIDFNPISTVLRRALTDIAKEIKTRIRREIGDWMVCSIGIGTNRFLAKTAAGLNKPDGLDIIDYRNLKRVYSGLTLTDLCGINTRFEARLNAYGIFTPLQFLDAPILLLKNQVFRSVVGFYWYRKLRGYEVEGEESETKSFGQDYALGRQTADTEELSKILMKLCEKMGRRLRSAGKMAYGIYLGIGYKDYSFWQRSKLMDSPMYTTMELFRAARLLLNQQEKGKVVAKLSVACYRLASSKRSQLLLFEDNDKGRKTSAAVDLINDKYGEFSIGSALNLNMEEVAIDRIAFGGIREL